VVRQLTEVENIKPANGHSKIPQTSNSAAGNTNRNGIGPRPAIHAGDSTSPAQVLVYLRYGLVRTCPVPSAAYQNVNAYSGQAKKKPRCRKEKVLLLESVRAEFDATTSTTETVGLFGHFRARPLPHGRAPRADSRPNALGCPTTRDTASSHAFSQV
jgi:hypothetical protein